MSIVSEHPAYLVNALVCRDNTFVPSTTAPPPTIIADIYLLVCVRVSTVGRCTRWWFWGTCTFSALTLLVGRQEGNLACKKTELWGAIFLERCADLHMAQLMPLSLASVKSRLVLPFWYRLTRVVPGTGPCVTRSQVIGCEDRLRNDLYCVEWGVKLYSNQTGQRAVKRLCVCVCVQGGDKCTPRITYRRHLRLNGIRF